METVIMHIGMHKTGSSSIQSSLKDYDDGETIYASFQENNHSVPIYTAFSKKNTEYHIWKKGGVSYEEIITLKTGYLETLGKNIARKDRKRVILSGEDIGLLLPEEKKELVNYIVSKGVSIKLICYLRSPTSYAASFFQHRVRTGANSIPTRISPQYKRRLEGFIENPKIDGLVVREFNKQNMINEDVVEDFIHINNLDNNLIKKKVRNEAPSLEALKLIFHFNQMNHCSFGDAVVLKARQRFVNRIYSLYKFGGSVGVDIFAPISDWSEIDYVQKKFGISFAKEDQQKNFGILTESFFDISDIDEQPLDEELLSKVGAGNYPNLASKLNRLFYWFVYREQLAVDEKRSDKFEHRKRKFFGISLG